MCEHEIVSCHAVLGSRDKQRFKPCQEWSCKDGTTGFWPDPGQILTPELATHLRTRISTINSPRLKARFADFLFCNAVDKSHARHDATSAIDAYIEATGVYFQRQWWPEFVDAAVRQLELSRSLNKGVPLPKSRAAILHALSCLLGHRKLGRAAQLLTVITEHKKSKLTVDEISDLDRRLSTLISEAQSADADLFSETKCLFEMRIALAKFVGDSDAVKTLTLEMATALEREAEWKRLHYPNGNFIAAHVLQDAWKLVVPFDKLRADALKTKIEHYQRVGSENELVTYAFEVPLPQELVENMFDQLRSNCPADLVLRLSSLDFVPSFEEIAAELAITGKDNLSRLVPLAVLRGSQKSLTLESEEEHVQEEAAREWLIHLGLLGNNVLPQAFEQFGEDKLSVVAEVQATLKGSFIHTSRHLALDHGLQAYAVRNWVAAMYILIPQIEGALRDLLDAAGFTVLSLRKSAKEQSARDLPDMLAEVKSCQWFAGNLYHLIRLLYSDKLGKNLRHDLAHGLNDPNVFTRENTEWTIVVLLAISAQTFSRAPP